MYFFPSLSYFFFCFSVFILEVTVVLFHFPFSTVQNRYTQSLRPLTHSLIRSSIYFDSVSLRMLYIFFVCSVFTFNDVDVDYMALWFWYPISNRKTTKLFWTEEQRNKGIKAEYTQSINSIHPSMMWYYKKLYETKRNVFRHIHIHSYIGIFKETEITLAM